jgi:protein TonB
MTGIGWRPTAPARADALLARLAGLEAEEQRRRRVLLLAGTAAVALHALLLVLAPRPDGATIVAPLPLRRFELAPVPELVEPPPKAERPPIEFRPEIPVPDPTPDGPEIVREEAPLPPIELELDGEVILLPAPPAPTAPAEGGDRVYGPADADVVPPVRLFSPDPVYPKPALLAKKEATVQLDAFVDAHGAVTSLRALTHHGFGLEQAALDAVRTWRFAPATRHGEPVAVRYRLSIQFRITR